MDSLHAPNPEGSSFPPTHLAPEHLSRTPITRTGDNSLVEIDEQDRAILSALARHPSQPRTALARMLHLPLSTLVYRINQLEQQQIIQVYLYHLNAGKLGLHAARLLIYERHSDPGLKKKLLAYAQANPFVSGFVHCIGGWDFELNVEVPDPRMLANFTDELFNRCVESIETIKIISLLQTEKICLYPFPPERNPH